MGAIVVDSSVSAGNWSKQKPDGYDSKELDKAIAAYEKLKSSSPTITLIPASMPTEGAKAYEACIKTLDTVTADMKKGVKYFKDLCASLGTVASAAKTVSGDLQKQAKDKDGAEKRKYLDAASVAAGISAQATATQKKYE